MEEVLVYGIRESLSTAQDLKRDAATVKDVITSSDIGALPDKSVVEALSRVPGVSIERFSASDDPDHFSVEGSGAVVRGLNRVRSEFNGRDSFSATSSSGLNFSDVPAELMGSVEVVKNLTADMIEGGIAGTINLVTRKPFDSPGMALGGTVKATHGDRIGGMEPDVSGIFSNRWETDVGEFGFLINASTSRFAARSEGLQLFPWYERSERGYLRDADGEPLQPLCPEWARDTCVDSNNDGVVDQFAWGEPLPYALDNSLGIGAPFTGAPGEAVLIAPAGVALRAQDNERSRTGFATSVQWRNPAESILVTAEFIRSKSELAWNERFVEYGAEPFDPDTFSKFTFVPDADDAERSSFEHSFNDDGWFTHGILGGLSYQNGTRQRQESSTINDYSVNLVYTPSDALTVSGDLQYIDASATINDYTIHSAISGVDQTSDDPDARIYPEIFVDLRGSAPYIEFMSLAGTEGSLLNPADTVLANAMDHESDNSGESFAVALDAEYAFDTGWVRSVKGGVRVSDKTQIRRETTYNWGNISQEWNSSRASFEEYPQYAEEYDFGSGFGAGSRLGGQTGFLFPRAELTNDLDAFFDSIWQDGAHAQGGADMWYPLRDPRRNSVAGNDPTDGSPFLPSEVAEINEKRNAVYAMVNFENEDLSVPVRGNFGLRYVDLDLTSSGSFTVEAADAGYLEADNWVTGEVGIPAEFREIMESSSVTPVSENATFSKLLPSFNINFSLTDEVIIRFAASQSIWLPDLQTARAVTHVTQDPVIPDVRLDLAGPDYAEFEGLNYRASDIGNPLLRPEVAVNLDLTAEWYFADVGSLTFSLFNKDIEDLHRRVAVTSVYNDLPFYYTTTENAGDAVIRGFELAYQQTMDFLPEPYNGLGLQANYTYIDANQTSSTVAAGEDGEYTFRWFDDLPLEGLSKDTANLVLFYENEYFSTRFAYNWRSTYLLNSRDVIAYSPIYNLSHGMLDFSFRYNLSDSIKVGFEVNNLLDTVTKTSIQFNQEGDLTPRSYFVNDRRFTLVLSASI